MISKIKEFFKKNEADIVLVGGIILISLISFGSGWLLAKNQSLNNSLVKNNNENEIKIEENELSLKNPEVLKKNDAQKLKAGIDNQTTEKTINNNPQKSNENSTTIENIEKNDKDNSSGTNCKYVGSKNSNVYHLPNCPGAKRIKEENKRCFSSKEEAEKAGYRPAQNCPGLQ